MKMNLRRTLIYTAVDRIKIKYETDIWVLKKEQKFYPQ
jgi:hypothetical protein